MDEGRLDLVALSCPQPLILTSTIPPDALLSTPVQEMPRTCGGLHPLFTVDRAYGGRDNLGNGPSCQSAVTSRMMAKILLAEDDTDMRRFLVRALQNAGFEVISYDNGLSAYQRLREEPFELLLTDIVMPEMDGIELARRASELDPDIKIMFITGFAAVALNADSHAPKNAKVLSKPVHLRDLVNEVHKMLAA